MLIFNLILNDWHCDNWHPMDSYKLSNELFNATLYYIYVKHIPNPPKSLKCMVNHKPRKKHMYKTIII